jgi:hypothetical protein
MTKSPTRRGTAKKASTTHRKPRRKVVAERATIIHRKKALNVVDKTVRDKTEAEVRDAQKPDEIVRQFGATQAQVSMRALAGKNPPQRIEDFQAQAPASMRALMEGKVNQTRALYQHSTDAFQAAFESWESSLDAFGQGAVTLNRKIMDIAGNNINTGFDLATRLVASNNLAEAMEVQTAYWRKQFSELRMQAEEVRALLQKVASNVLEPIKAQVARDIDDSISLIKSAQS